MHNYKYLRKSLAEKIDYSYASYGGDSFLEGYYIAREDVINNLSEYLSSNTIQEYVEMSDDEKIKFVFFDKRLNNSKFISKLGPKALQAEKLSQQSASLKGSNGFATKEVLQSILISRLDNSFIKAEKANQIIEKLSKKYEIFQRIFSHYNGSCRRTTDDFGNISNYILLAVIAADIFEKDNDSRYLNLLLKINDFLMTIDYKSLKLIDALLLLISLEKETSIIKLIGK